MFRTKKALLALAMAATVLSGWWGCGDGWNWKWWLGVAQFANDVTTTLDNVGILKG
jgi:hypothetical protein